MIVIERPSYDALVEHAREGKPNEVCGVLGGTYGEERSTVETVARTSNISPNPASEYHMDPEEQLDRLEAIEHQGLDVVGFYHSHPTGPPAPSRTDVARATWAGYSYVIIELAGEPVVGSWRWNGDDERFEPEIVRVTRE